MIAEPSLESFKDDARQPRRTSPGAASEESPGKVPLYEYTWNHTTLQVLKADRSRHLSPVPLSRRTGCWPPWREIGTCSADEVLPHLEFIRFGGRVT